MTNTLNSDDLSSKIRGIENELNKHHVERQQEIRGLSLATIAKTNILFLGSPGVGKSLLIRDFSARITPCNFFEWLVGKYTTPDELFGAFSLKKLQEDKFQRNTEGMLSEAHFAFLDEIWECNNGTTNALLALMNERVFHNGGTKVNSPLIMLAAASNHLPENNENMAAALDRFVIKLNVDTIQEDSNFYKMLEASLKERGPIENSITLSEVLELQKLRSKIEVPPNILNAIIEIKNELSAEGIIVSPRTGNQTLKILQANALIEGRKEVDTSDLEVLTNVLWTSLEDINTVSKIVLSKITPYSEKIIETFLEAEDVMNLYSKAFNEKGTSGHFIHFASDLTELRERLEKIREQINDKKNTKIVSKKIKTIESWIEQIFHEGHGIQRTLTGRG